MEGERPAVQPVPLTCKPLVEARIASARSLDDPLVHTAN